MKVSYHTMGTQHDEAKSQAKALQRFTIKANREKVWICSAPRSTPAPASGSAELGPSWHNLGKYIDVGNLPNMYMQIAWDITVELQGTQQHFIQFERPYLIWNRTLSFKKDQWFRWA